MANSEARTVKAAASAKTARTAKTFKAAVRHCALIFLRYANRRTDLNEHSKQLQTYMPHPTHKERQRFLSESIDKELERIFSAGSTIADDARGESFDLNNFDRGNDEACNIVDHHDILNRDAFFTPDMVANFFRLGRESDAGTREGKKKAIITITDSGIAVDHYGNKRGVNVDGGRIRLFPHSKRHLTIYGASGLKPSQVNNLLEYIPARATAEGGVGAETAVSQSERGRHSTAAQMLAGKEYKDQVTILNHLLWKYLFAEDVRNSVPELFQVPGEALAATMIETYLRDPRHIFHKMLFDKAAREMTIRLFDTLRGCWNNDKSYGTHFFWAIDERGESERLWINETKETLDGTPARLESLDGSISIELAPERVIAGLRSKAIYPGLFLVYGVLIFYCGIKPLTGGRSTGEIMSMKEQWIKLHAPLGTPTDKDGKQHDGLSEAQLIQEIPINTDNIVQDAPSLPYAFDIISKGGLTIRDLENLERDRINGKLIVRLAARLKRAFRAVV